MSFNLFLKLNNKIYEKITITYPFDQAITKAPFKGALF